jgi:putative SOS response-associated peptidase YedK
LAKFNTRAETVETKPFFREAFKRRCCLMPLSGYYEWHEDELENKKKKPQPDYFTARDGSLVEGSIFLDKPYQPSLIVDTIRRLLG